jgi:hypothetical protein
MDRVGVFHNGYVSSLRYGIYDVAAGEQDSLFVALHCFVLQTEEVPKTTRLMVISIRGVL